MTQMTCIDRYILDGHLLGDASILNHHPDRNKNWCFVLYSIHSEYLQYSADTITCLKDRPIWSRAQKDKRTNKTYNSFYLRSLSEDYFTKQRERWYPEGKKIVPCDLVITKETLLSWYMDDGSISTSKGRYLATDSFTLEDVNLLKKYLARDLDIESAIHKNDSHFRLYIPVREVSKFEKCIGSCPVECFRYKWTG